MISTVIFDMDGVLINSQAVLDKLETAYLKEVTNNKWTGQDQLSIHGKSIKDVFDLLVSSRNFAMSKKTFFNRYERILNITYTEKCKLYPGVKSFLKNIASKKYRIALASSTAHRFISVVLDKFELRKYFTVIVSADDIKGKSKPEPDIFILTAQKLGVKPGECLVIEDSNNGIKAAKRAGMFCGEYINYHGKKRGVFADVTIETFNKLTISSIIHQLKKDTADIEKISIGENTYYFQLSEKVNKSDYYSDFLLAELKVLLRNSKNRNELRLLEIGTGRGYIPIILASKFPNIKKIIAVDIDKEAVKLAIKNVWLNEFESIIEIRQGDLYSPLKKHELFDFIFSAPPQIPITKKEIKKLIKKYKEILPYHLNTSTGGKNGQLLVRKLIKHASQYLFPKGLFIEVQADFSYSKSLENFIEESGLTIDKITKKQKLLKETSLTKKLEPVFKKAGYIFKKNNQNEKYFNLLNIVLKN